MITCNNEKCLWCNWSLDVNKSNPPVCLRTDNTLTASLPSYPKRNQLICLDFTEKRVDNPEKSW